MGLTSQRKSVLCPGHTAKRKSVPAVPGHVSYCRFITAVPEITSGMGEIIMEMLETVLHTVIELAIILFEYIGVFVVVFSGIQCMLN